MREVSMARTWDSFRVDPLVSVCVDLAGLFESERSFFDAYGKSVIAEGGR